MGSSCSPSSSSPKTNPCQFSLVQLHRSVHALRSTKMLLSTETISACRATGDVERGLLSSETTETLADDDAGKRRASSQPGKSRAPVAHDAGKSQASQRPSSRPSSASEWMSRAAESGPLARKTTTRTTASQTVPQQQILQQQQQQQRRHTQGTYNMHYYTALRVLPVLLSVARLSSSGRMGSELKNGKKTERKTKKRSERFLCRNSR